MKLLVLIMVLCFIGLVVIIVFAPSCKDKGGTIVFSHYQPIWNGKFMQIMPVYDCVIPKNINKEEE